MPTSEIINKYNEIIKWLQCYKEQTNCRGVVLGISGGKDSTIVAMLVKKVWGDNVFGILMPNGKQQDIDDSLHVVKSLGIKHRIVNIGTLYNSLVHSIENRTEETPIKNSCVASYSSITDKAKTNIPPRLRMTVLYAVAQTLGYRVAGTGNASEIYIGWTTKWGDSAYDFNPIAHLTCTEVVALGELLADEFGLDKKYIAKPPSDGLCGKNDEDSFGFSYAVLDEYLTGGAMNTDCETGIKIEEMHLLSGHKRNMPAILN